MHRIERCDRCNQPRIICKSIDEPCENGVYKYKYYDPGSGNEEKVEIVVVDNNIIIESQYQLTEYGGINKIYFGDSYDIDSTNYYKYEFYDDEDAEIRFNILDSVAIETEEEKLRTVHDVFTKKYKFSFDD